MTQQSRRGVAIPATPLSRHGLLTSADLRATGLTQGAIWRRVQRGALFRRYHGVYSLSPGELSREGEWTAALLAAGEGATLCDLSAAVLAKVWRYPEDAIDVTLARRHVPIPGVRLHQRRLDPLDVYVHNGIRVTTVARTCVDLSGVLTRCPECHLEASGSARLDLPTGWLAPSAARGRSGPDTHHDRPPTASDDRPARRGARGRGLDHAALPTGRDRTPARAGTGSRRMRFGTPATPFRCLASLTGATTGL